MPRFTFARFALPAIIAAFSMVAHAASINMGFVSFDVTNPPVAQFDITNQTGPNASTFPDTTFPVTTSVSFSSLSLTVKFVGGFSEAFGPSSGYFTLGPDGLSFNGQDIFNTSTSSVSSAILSGTFDTTSLTLNGGTTMKIDSSFSATITPSSGASLNDGDFAVITATPCVGSSCGGPPPTVPEPATWTLLFAGSMLGLAYRFRKSLTAIRLGTKLAAGSLCLAVAGLLPISARAATTPVKLNVTTSPSSGQAGLTNVWVTGSGFPGAPEASKTTITLAKTCGGAAAATTHPIAVTNVIGSSYRLQFTVPASLATATYDVSVSGVTTSGAPFDSSNCSSIQVTHVAPVLKSCNPGSSMGILSYNPTGAATTPVVAYVPNGSWGSGTTGIQVVPIEGGGSGSSVTTTVEINSCSSNSNTGVSVCIDNTTGVYLLQGSSITHTLKSSADTTNGFSGGSCENCTVAINQAAGTAGQAVIGIGFSSATSNTAMQFLDLGTLAFGTPVPLHHEYSEDILWDPLRNRVLSPNEANNYDLVDVTGTGIPGPTNTAEFSRSMGTGGDPDSAGMDCSTNIALSTVEFTGDLYIADLSQVTLTPGTPGSWTAPSQIVSFPEFDSLDAGTSAIAIAPGSTHLGIVNGEFGGNIIGAVKLPSTSGSGTPAFVDYVAATLPATPDSCGFAAGFDPHTTTAYTSPNNGKAYGVVADWAEEPPDYLAVIDLAALLAAPRTSGTHSVQPSYDLVAHGVVTYVPTGSSNCKGVKGSVAAPLTKTPINKRIY